LSIEELAEKAAITPSFLGQIERGQRKLSVATLEKVSLALNIIPANLMKDHMPKRNIDWEDRLLSLVGQQSARRKTLIFATLKFLLRQLRQSTRKK